MQWLSLVVAFALLIGSVFLFFGGVGPLIMIGAIFDRSEISPVVPWTIAAIYLLAYWGGIVVCFLRFRALGEQMKTSFDRAPTIFDRLVVLGHLLLLGALVHVILRKLQLWDWDLFYALLMVAALFYSAGLGGWPYLGVGADAPPAALQFRYPTVAVGRRSTNTLGVKSCCASSGHAHRVRLTVLSTPQTMRTAGATHACWPRISDCLCRGRLPAWAQSRYSR